MARCAYAHDFAAPSWEVRGKYRRNLKIELSDGTIVALDLASLDGKPFLLNDLGSYPNWFRILRDARKILAARLGP
jgi:hypothetical protein